MKRPATILALAAATLGAPAMAHGLLVSIRGEGSAISGRVYYSDGTAGAGQYVELTDLDAPAGRPRSGKTDDGGAFRFPGTPGHRYRFLAEGEEGHQTEMMITLAEGARGEFVDRDAAPVAAGWLPPAWLTIGGGLLLLSAVALLAQRRRTTR